jgi:hypothetical protein
MIELWKDIQGYEGLYQVSNLGRVKSLPKYVKTGKGGKGKRYIPENLLTPCKKENNYFFVALAKDGIKNCHYLHRLVALAFIPNPENKPQVNHLKSDKSDNRASELEWSTRNENLLHSFREGTHKPMRGTISPKAKLNDEKVYSIKETYSNGGISIRKLALEYGVHHSVIDGIIHGKRWPHVQLKTA